MILLGHTQFHAPRGLFYFKWTLFLSLGWKLFMLSCHVDEGKGQPWDQERKKKKHEFGLLANIKLGNVRGFTRPSNSPRANGCLPLSPTWAMRYGYSSMLGPPLNSNSAVNCSSQQIFDFVHTITFFNSILYGFYLKLLLIFIYIFFLSLLGGFESPHRSGYIPILVHPGPSWSIIPFSPWGVPTFWACNGQNSQWQFVVSCRGPRHWVPLGTTGYWGSGKVAFHQDSNMWYFVISCVIHPISVSRSSLSPPPAAFFPMPGITMAQTQGHQKNVEHRTTWDI